MSRIDEALKRAQGTVGSPTVPAAGPVPDIPPAEVFEDAWAKGQEHAQLAEERPVRPRVPLAVVPREESASELHEVQRETAADAGAAGLSAGPLALFREFDPALAEKIVATPTIRPAFVEQYRRLASTLHHAQVEQNLKTVMVTSALAGEGKTLTATNVALTLSESYRRSVLLIDADLRRPTLHDLFRVPNVSGLGDGLRGGHDQRLSLIEISARLTLLTAGRPDPDPMGSLASDRMKQLLEEAATRFDWVLVDTPPVGLLPDANLLARMVDGTLFVVRAGKTPFQIVQKAIATIGRDRIIGVVLNATEESLDTSYAYYRYYDTRGKKDGR